MVTAAPVLKTAKSSPARTAARSLPSRGSRCGQKRPSRSAAGARPHLSRSEQLDILEKSFMGHEAVLAAAQKATTEAETARHNKVSEQTQADRPETSTVQTGKVGSCTLIRRWGTRRKFLTQGIQYKFVVTSTGGSNC